MKKALAILMIFALVASVAVAEISVSGWGRGIFVPVQADAVDGAKNTTSIQKTWDGRAQDSSPRIGFTIAGNSDNVGFQVDIRAAENEGKDDPNAKELIGLNDVAKIWVKPMDMVTLTIGRYFDDTLRGNTAFGSYDWLRGYGAGEGEDVTFMRLSSASGGWAKDYSTAQGFMVTARPMDPLFVALNFADASGLTEDLFEKVQVQVGYEIDGVGLLRAQYYSQSIVVDGDTEADGTIEVAFKLTMVENLYADFGLRMYLSDDGQNKDKEKQVSAYANYSMDAMTFHLLGIFKLFDKADSQYTFGTGVDYDMGEGIGINADVRYYNDAMAGGKDAKITFMAGVKKGFSNGLVGVGVQVLSAEEMGWAIPVRMEYWF